MIVTEEQILRELSQVKGIERVTLETRIKYFEAQLADLEKENQNSTNSTAEATARFMLKEQLKRLIEVNKKLLKELDD